MKINWKTLGEEWAFKNLYEHFSNALPDFEHELNGTGDIDFLFTASQFRTHKADKKTILHIDSNRWYNPKGE